VILFVSNCKSLQQWGLHQLPKDTSHAFVELSSPTLGIHPPSFSWNSHSWWHPVLTDCTSAHLENLSWRLRTWGCCWSVQSVSKCYPLSSLRLALGRGCPCPLKNHGGRRGVESYFALPVLSAGSQSLCTTSDALLLCSVFRAGWAPCSTDGEGGMALPNQVTCIPPDRRNNCCCYCC